MKSLRFVFIVSIIFLWFLGCNKKTKNEDKPIMKISLKKEIGNHRIFDSLYINFHFASPYLKHPEFYSDRVARLKGYPAVDTGIVSLRFADKRRFWYQLLAKGFSNDSTLVKRLEGVNADSLGYGIEIDNTFTLFTGIKGDKQVVILDANKNNDFGDDRVQEFHRDFTKNPVKDTVLFNSFPLLDYRYEIYNQGKIDQYERKAIVYPSKNHAYTYSFLGDSLNKKLHVMGKLKDYWLGELLIDEHKYDVFCQGFSKAYLQILIKPDSVELDQRDYIKNKKFEYKIKDTFSLSNNTFVIDSFSLDDSELVLRKLDDEHRYFGFREGETIDDLEFTDLNGESFNISGLNQNGKYLLLDIWGTWCPPCRETTPLLKEMYSKHSKNLEMFGVAYDNGTKEVLDYTTKNNMVWPQAFIKRIYDPNSIVQKLRIGYFPTFLLLDKDYKIVKRTIGMDGLKEIDAYLVKTIE